jgi:hypothetical protein
MVVYAAHVTNAAREKFWECSCLMNDCSCYIKNGRQTWPVVELNIDDHENILGPAHPSTLTIRNNLAGAYRSAGPHPTKVTKLLECLLDSTRAQYLNETQCGVTCYISTVSGVDVFATTP